MVPDYSFDLYFPVASRTVALTALSRLCTRDTVHALQSAIQQEGDATANIVLALAADAALARWRADNPAMHQNAIADEVRIGVITIWVKLATDNRVCITLWPVTRNMQIACLDSPTLRRALVALLSENQGIAGYLDRGDGSFAELWPRDERPASPRSAL